MYDMFIATGNYHGQDLHFYNGTINRPDFVYFKNENSFKIDSLDYTYDDQKFSNTSLQKTIQLDKDKSEEILILAYEGQVENKGVMGIYDYDGNRYNLIKQVFRQIIEII